MSSMIVVGFDAAGVRGDPRAVATDLGRRFGLPFKFAYVVDANGGVPSGGTWSEDRRVARPHLGDVLIEER